MSWSQVHSYTHARGSSSESYHYEPLEGDGVPIRLLRIHPGAEDDDIRCSLATYDLYGTTPYAAASYTWGDPKAVATIWLDGKPLEVRESCRFLLWQFRLHNSHSHYWIDALCINQQDMDERSKQVELMWWIYATADCVFISLSEDISDVAFLAQSIKQTTTELAATHAAQNKQHGTRRCKLHSDTHQCSLPDASELVDQIATVERFVEGKNRVWSWWYGSQDENTRLRFCKIVLQIEESAYWERLWIVQEVMAARRLILLCGSAAIRWDALVVLLMGIGTSASPTAKSSGNAGLCECESRLAGGHIMRYGGFDHARRVGHYSTLGTDDGQVDLIGHLRRHARRRCADVRDRIYGLQAVSQSQLPYTPLRPIPVDYRIDTAQLAVRVLEHEHPYSPPDPPRPDRSFPNTTSKLFRSIDVIQEALELDLSTPSIADRHLLLIRSAAEGALACSQEHQSSAITKRWSNEVDLRSPNYYILPAGCAVALQETDGGDFLARLTGNSQDHLKQYSEDGVDSGLQGDENDQSARVEAQRFMDFCHEHSLNPPSKVYCNDRLAALVCGASRPGDCLIRVQTSEEALTFIARQCLDNDTILAIIGQAVLVKGYRQCSHSIDCHGGKDFTVDQPPDATEGQRSAGADGTNDTPRRKYRIYCTAEDLLLLKCQPVLEHHRDQWRNGILRVPTSKHCSQDGSLVNSRFESGLVRLLPRVCADGGKMSTFAVVEAFS